MRFIERRRRSASDVTLPQRVRLGETCDFPHFKVARGRSITQATNWSFSMHPASTTHTTQVLTPFGGGYVPEQHNDQSCRNLAPSERALDYEAILAALRAAIFGARPA